VTLPGLGTLSSAEIDQKSEPLGSLGTQLVNNNKKPFCVCFLFLFFVFCFCFFCYFSVGLKGLQGMWLHGFRLDLAVSDENLKKDSETQLEAVVRMLNEAWNRAGQRLPFGLHSQCDNCFREGKNKWYVGVFCFL
jgi:hypothetical protein